MMIVSVCCIIQQNMAMENKSNGLSPCRSQSVLRKYHQLTSPLVSLQSVKRQDAMKEEMRQNVSMRLDCIKGGGSKVYALDTSLSFPELKAAATLYQIPEFSTPEVNFEVSEQIRKKVEQARREIVSCLPEISRSSNYAPRKVEHQLSQRAAVRELEEWLAEKLRAPPTSTEESIEYKNMIMGVGMKELIRIIGRRCSEEGRMAEEIWELTWSICREIILYLSKRAKKCEQLLEQELLFMRASYQKEFDRLAAENTRLAALHRTLEEEHSELQAEAGRLRRRRQGLEEENKTLGFDNVHLQQEFKKVLEENLAIYLQIGDKNKRGWIRKMYKNISALPEDAERTVKDVFRKEVAEVVEDRIKLEEVTGDCEEVMDAGQIEAIGNAVLQKSANSKHRRSKKKKGPRASKPATSSTNNNALITEPTNDEAVSQTESELSEPSCADMIDHMREEFLPVDAEAQTDAKQLIDAYASTLAIELADQEVNVDVASLGLLEEVGVNTEELKEQVKTSKKKGKENSKEESRKDKSKLYSGPPLREKSKPKGDAKDKEKKSILDIVQETNTHQEDSRFSQKEESLSVVNEQLPAENMAHHESRSELSQLPEVRAFEKKNSFFTAAEPVELTAKTNSAIYSSAFALEVREKATAHLLPHKQEDAAISLLEKDIFISPPKPALVGKGAEEWRLPSMQGNEKQAHSISCDAGINRLREDERSCKTGGLSDCSVYICAECNKLISSLDQKYENPRNRLSQLEKASLHEEKRSIRGSPVSSIKRLSPSGDGNDEEAGGEKRSSGMRRVRRQNRKNSSYIHDIGFKKELQEQQQAQQTPFKSTFYNGSKDETYENYQEAEYGELPLQQQQNAFNKVPPHALLFTQLLDGNRPLIQAIVNAPQQQAENLEHYFQMVREVNALPEGKMAMSQKSAVSIIEKTVFPIMGELLGIVRKAVKNNRIAETIRVFTSLPSIVYTRIARKYGVRILAIKNLKVLLMALREAGRFTDKYKIIELMMFTDCKSPHSEDLFMYLFAMALFDPSFSATRTLTPEDARTLRTLCQDYLSRDVSLYGEFERVGEQGAGLTGLVKGVVTSYRLLKINRIEEVGFVYLMLKKDHHMTYKKFIYFLSALAIPHPTKLAIAKKLLEFCDIRLKDRIAISEIMFSKFLMNCEDFNYRMLEQAVNKQLEGYRAADKEKDIVSHISSQFFKTQKCIRTKYDFEQVDPRNKVLLEAESPRDSIAVDHDGSILSEGSAVQGQGQGEKVVESVTVARQMKEYSSFTFQVCRYLQNGEETKYLSSRQHLFVKNYLIVHIIEAEIEKTLGLADYFSNSMLPLLSTPAHQLTVLLK